MTRHLAAALLVAALLPLAAEDAAPPAPKPSEKAAAVLATVSAALDQAALLDDAGKAFAKGTLLALCTHPVLVAETVKQNAAKAKAEDIQKIDQDWQAAEGELPIMKEKLGNACATALKAFVAAQPTVVEIFAMDDQGANVGQNQLTSDYWQGDEDKWKKSFNGGKGGIDVGKPKADKSAGATIQQISLPLVADDGTVVGAVCCGIKVAASK